MIKQFVSPPVVLSKEQKFTLFVLCLTVVVNQYDFGILSIALPRIQEGLMIPDDEVGQLMAVAKLGSIPALLIALAADYYGRVRMLMFTIWAFMLFSFLSAFAQNAQQLMIAQFLAKSFLSAEHLLSFVVIIENMPVRNRGWCVGVLGACGALGHGIASLSFSVIDVLPYGWRFLYIVSIAPLFFIAWLRRQLPKEEGFVKPDRSSFDFKRYLMPLKNIWERQAGIFLVMCTTVFVFWFSAATSMSFMSKYLVSERYFETWNVSVLFLTGGIVAIMGNLISGSASDRLGRKKTLLACMVCTAIGLLVFYRSDGAVLVAGWIFMMFFFFGAEVLLTALSVELFELSYRASASKIIGAVGAIGAAFGLMVEGELYQYTQSHSEAIQIMMLVYVFAPLIILFKVPDLKSSPVALEAEAVKG